MKKKKSPKKYIILTGLGIIILMLILGTITQEGDKVDNIFMVGFYLGLATIIVGCFFKSQKKLDREYEELHRAPDTNYDEVKNKIYTFKSVQSGTANIIINDDKITIKRSGLLSANAHGLTGEKTIRISQISAVQLKEAKTTIGYIQFVLIGSQESKGGLQEAMYDENTVCFDGGFDPKTHNKNAREIKDYIEKYLSEHDKGNNVVIKKEDKYDQVAKLKQLLDDGAITKEEFEKEKKKIMK